jgi:predicted dehydrogenase
MTDVSQPLKIGIIGLGRMGQNHLRVLSNLAGTKVAFIADADHSKADELGRRYRIPVAHDLEAALGAADGVIIASPTVTHEEQIKRAARYVRNIFVEKPLTQDRRSSEAIRDLIQSEDINLQVGFIERYNPAVEQVKRLLDRSDEVVSVDFVRTNKLSSRITDVDVVTDLMIHDIDLALYLNGPVSTLSAHGVTTGQMIDFASALLTHANGRFSRIQASRITDQKMRRIQVTCRDMFIDCELLRKEISISRQSEVEQRPGEPYKITSVTESIEVLPREALLLELQAFVSSGRGEECSSRPKADEGVAAMVICDEVQRAILG